MGCSCSKSELKKEPPVTERTTANAPKVNLGKHLEDRKSDLDSEQPAQKVEEGLDNENEHKIETKRKVSVIKEQVPEDPPNAEEESKDKAEAELKMGDEAVVSKQENLNAVEILNVTTKSSEENVEKEGLEESRQSAEAEHLEPEEPRQSAGAGLITGMQTAGAGLIAGMDSKEESSSDGKMGEDKVIETTDQEPQVNKVLDNMGQKVDKLMKSLASQEDGITQWLLPPDASPKPKVKSTRKSLPADSGASEKALNTRQIFSAKVSTRKMLVEPAKSQPDPVASWLMPAKKTALQGRNAGSFTKRAPGTYGDNEETKPKAALVNPIADDFRQLARLASRNSANEDLSTNSSSEKKSGNESSGVGESRNEEVTGEEDLSVRFRGLSEVERTSFRNPK